MILASGDMIFIPSFSQSVSQFMSFVLVTVIEYELCKSWLDINEEIAYRKVLSCTKKIMVKNIGKFLFRVKCKWEWKVKKMGI
jgi:hypothetical protein